MYTKKKKQGGDTRDTHSLWISSSFSFCLIISVTVVPETTTTTKKNKQECSELRVRTILILINSISELCKSHQNLVFKNKRQNVFLTNSSHEVPKDQDTPNRIPPVCKGNFNQTRWPIRAEHACLLLSTLMKPRCETSYLFSRLSFLVSIFLSSITASFTEA